MSLWIWFIFEVKYKLLMFCVILIVILYNEEIFWFFWFLIIEIMLDSRVYKYELYLK